VGLCWAGRVDVRAKTPRAVRRVKALSSPSGEGWGWRAVGGSQHGATAWPSAQPSPQKGRGRSNSAAAGLLHSSEKHTAGSCRWRRCRGSSRIEARGRSRWRLAGKMWISPKLIEEKPTIMPSSRHRLANGGRFELKSNRNRPPFSPAAWSTLGGHSSGAGRSMSSCFLHIHEPKVWANRRGVRRSRNLVGPRFAATARSRLRLHADHLSNCGTLRAADAGTSGAHRRKGPGAQGRSAGRRPITRRNGAGGATGRCTSGKGSCRKGRIRHSRAGWLTGFREAGVGPRRSRILGRLYCQSSQIGASNSVHEGATRQQARNRRPIGIRRSNGALNWQRARAAHAEGKTPAARRRSVRIRFFARPRGSGIERFSAHGTTRTTRKTRPDDVSTTLARGKTRRLAYDVGWPERSATAFAIRDRLGPKPPSESSSGNEDRHGLGGKSGLQLHARTLNFRQTTGCCRPPATAPHWAKTARFAGDGRAGRGGRAGATRRHQHETATSGRQALKTNNDCRA